jgi:hypothetical protein|tara:strand:+ start:821 stop:1024 length:204 start_codon:yes stop_codon:yes gene_type:complete
MMTSEPKDIVVTLSVADVRKLLDDGDVAHDNATIAKLMDSIRDEGSDMAKELLEGCVDDWAINFLDM